MSDFATDAAKASYGIGRQLGEHLIQQGYDELDIAAIQQGLADALRGEEFAVAPDAINQAYAVLTERMQQAQQAQADAAINAGRRFLEQNAQREAVQTTVSGLQYEIITVGEGSQSPQASDKVVVHYHGELTDGSVFDSSVARGEPITLPVNGVIQGWQEALQLMTPGDKWKLYVPYELGYGERGTGGIPPFATLVFEVELLSIL